MEPQTDQQIQLLCSQYVLCNSRSYGGRNYAETDNSIFNLQIHSERTSNHLPGASRNGKTYFACTLEEAFRRELFSARCIRMLEMLEESMIAKEQKKLKKTMKAYEKSIC